MSHKILYVGDMHVVPEEIEDAQNLLNYVFTLAIEHQATVCFLGDQHHTHSIVRLEVLRFWRENFIKFKKNNIEVIALVGNHDLSNSHHDQEHAMLAYGDLIDVIDKPTANWVEGILFLPYFPSNEKFIEVCKKWSKDFSTVVCHQTFNGAIYDNGFYAKDGIDVAAIPQTQIISGHIHGWFHQGKLLYIGSPRWRTFSDTNIDKFLCLIIHGRGGEIQDIIKFPTDLVCKKIISITEKEFLNIPSLDPSRYKIQLILEGTKEEIIQKKSLYANKGYSIKGVIKQNTIPLKVRESEGIKIAFRKYFDEATNKCSTSKDDLLSLVHQRLFVEF